MKSLFSPIIVLLLVSSPSCFAGNVQAVELKDLESSDRQVREAAFYGLVDIPTGASGMGMDLDNIKLKSRYANNDEVKKQLRKLISIEDGVAKSSDKSRYSVGQRERYLDYRYAVMSLLVNLSDIKDIQYVLSDNNPSIMVRLAKMGEPVVDPVLKKFKDGGKLDKHMASVMLAAMAKQQTPIFPYSEASKNKIKDGLMEAAKYKGRWQIRTNAVYGIQELIQRGHSELIEIMEGLEEDNYVMENGDAPVKNAAHSALEELKAKGLYKGKKLQPGTTQGITTR